MAISKKLIFVLLFFCSIPGYLFAQEDDEEEENGGIKERNIDLREKSKKEKKLLSKARDLYADGDYNQAKKNYLQLLRMDSTDATYNFELGTNYFDSPYEKLKALPYFEKALRFSAGDTVGELFFYLGKAYHLANRFDEAIRVYTRYYELVQEFGTELPGKQEKELLNEITRLIDMCNYAKELIAHPVKVAISPLSSSINSPYYPDYAPVISADESILVFTSRRKGSTGGLQDENGDYYEDIYTSRKMNWEWTSPEKYDSLSKLAKGNKGLSFSKANEMAAPANTRGHDAALALSFDGQCLYIYKKENIYVSRLKGSTWSVPVKLNSYINPGNSRQPSLSISPDGKTIYFVSDQKGGYGGQDIYKSELQPTGDWGRVVNLGPTINTPFDEDSPYMHPDGRTLYFSSDGHRTMGGYDIFKSVSEANGKWSEPENLGYPINTSGDDTHFVINAKGDHAFYASVREREGKLESMDIYLLLFEGVSVPVTQIKGIVLGGNPSKPMPATIHVTDKSTGKEIMVVNSNSMTGEYLLVLPPGVKYNISINAEGYKPYSEDVYIPDQKSFYQLFQEVTIAPVKAGNQLVGQQVTMLNAFFDIDKAMNSDSALFNDLVSKLKENVTLNTAKTIEKPTKGKLSIKGLVLGAGSLKPIVANIKITDKKTGKEISSFNTSAASGEYALLLPGGKTYVVSISADGYTPHSEEVDIPKQSAYAKLNFDVKLVPENESNKKYSLPANFFDVSQALVNDSLTEEEMAIIQERIFREKLFSSYVNALSKNEVSQSSINSALEDTLAKKDSLAYKTESKINFFISNDSIAKVLDVPLATIDNITNRSADEVADLFELPSQSLSQISELQQATTKEILKLPTDSLISLLKKQNELEALALHKQNKLDSLALVKQKELDELAKNKQIELDELAMLEKQNSLSILNLPTDSSQEILKKQNELKLLTLKKQHELDSLALQKQRELEASALEKQMELEALAKNKQRELKLLNGSKDSVMPFLGFAMRKKQQELEALVPVKKIEPIIENPKKDSVTSLLVSIPQYHNLLFDFNKSNLERESQLELNKVYAFLHGNKSTTIELVGFSDAKGSDNYNIILSMKRTQSALNYLISKGINKKRILAKQKGKQNPIAPNEFPDKTDNPDGRKLNRRVEIKINQ